MKLQIYTRQGWSLTRWERDRGVRKGTDNAIQTAPTRGTAPQSRPQMSPTAWRIQCTASRSWSCHSPRPSRDQSVSQHGSSYPARARARRGAGRTLSKEASGSRYLASLEDSAWPPPFDCCAWACARDCFADDLALAIPRPCCRSLRVGE